MDHQSIAKALDASRSRIVERVAQETLQNPFWEERYGSGVRDKLVFDGEHNLAALVKAIRYRSQIILDDYLAWLRTTLVRYNCSTGMIHETFAYIWHGIQAELPHAAHAPLYSYIQAGLQSLAYPAPQIQELAASHEQLAELLTSHLYDSQWHWQQAYAHTGRARMLYDAWLLLDYVMDAMGYNDPQVAVRHTVWLRDYLLKAGLSTTHMQQLLWMLTGILEQQTSPAAASDARRVLATVASALLYDEAAYHALLSVQDELVQEVAQALAVHDSRLVMEQVLQETGWYVAYLGDALGTHTADPLVRYVRMVQQAGADPQLLHAHLAELHTAAARLLPTYAANDTQAYLQAAAASLQAYPQMIG